MELVMGRSKHFMWELSERVSIKKSGLELSLGICWVCIWGFLGGASGKEPACQCKRCKRWEFDRWVRKIPWRKTRQSTPVFLPGESHGQESLAGCSSWYCKYSDTTEATYHACMQDLYLERRKWRSSPDMRWSESSFWVWLWVWSWAGLSCQQNWKQTQLLQSKWREREHLKRGIHFLKKTEC